MKVQSGEKFVAEMMRGICKWASVFLVVATSAPAIHASDLSVTATLTSEYIFRGFSRSDGDPALQLGADYEHDSGWFGGVWASTIDLYDPDSDGNVELDFYAGYHHEFQAPWSASVMLLRYTYPGDTQADDYNYNELLMSLTWQGRYTVEMGFIDDFGEYYEDARHIEFQVDYPVANTWVVGATLGRNDISAPGVTPYYYWDVGASVRWSRAVFDLRWFDNEEPGGYAALESAGAQLVFSLSMTF